MASNAGTVNVNLLLGTCKTCKWWAAPDHYVQAKTDAKICHSPKLIDIDEKGYQAVTKDGFGLDYPVCNLMTGPDFGCIHHESPE